MERAEFKPCPYWRRRVIYDGAILALCGRESENEPIALDDEVPSLKECPFGFDAWEAYMAPQIMEVSNGDFQTIVGAGIYDLINPKKALEKLESRWPGEVEKFIQRHSQP